MVTRAATVDEPLKEISFPLDTVPVPSDISRFIHKYMSKSKSKSHSADLPVQTTLKLICVTLPPLRTEYSSTPFARFSDDTTDLPASTLSSLPGPLQKVMEHLKRQFLALCSAEILDCLRRERLLQQKHLDIVQFRLTNVLSHKDPTRALQKHWYQYTMSLDFLHVSEEMLAKSQELFLQELEKVPDLCFKRYHVPPPSCPVFNSLTLL